MLAQNFTSCSEPAATTSESWRHWKTTHTKASSAFLECTDNFVSLKKEVHVELCTLSQYAHVPTDFLVIKGQTRVEDPVSMFDNGHPEDDWGGVLNMKGVGLKFFQSHFGLELLVFLLRDGEGYIIRYGRDHDEATAQSLNQRVTIRKTIGRIDIANRDILFVHHRDADARQALFMNNPFCPGDNMQNNKKHVISLFDEILPMGPNATMFVYYGLGQPGYPTLTKSINPQTNTMDLLFVGENKYLSDTLIHAYLPRCTIDAGTHAFEGTVCGNSVDCKRHSFYDLVDAPCAPIEFGADRGFRTRMVGGWIQDKKSRPDRMSGSYICYNGRMLSLDPYEFYEFYDQLVDSSKKCEDCFQTCFGGKAQKYLASKLVQTLKANLCGREPPFTKDDILKVIEGHHPYRPALYALLGYSSLFIVRCDNLQLNQSKERLNLQTDKFQTRDFMIEVRYQILKWNFENINTLTYLTKNTNRPVVPSRKLLMPPKEMHPEEEDMDSDGTEDESGQRRSKRQRMAIVPTNAVSLGSISATSSPAQRKPRVTLKMKLKNICEKYGKHSAANAAQWGPSLLAEVAQLTK